jgi:hypothetical protein
MTPLSREHKRDALPKLERAVSDTLDEYLSRLHGVFSSWAYPDEFIEFLAERGYIIRKKPSPPKEPTLFRVRLLTRAFGNSEGDILSVKVVDDAGSIYYYDGFRRWCYLEASEEGVSWERIGKPKQEADA